MTREPAVRPVKAASEHEVEATLDRIMAQARHVTGCDAVGIFRRWRPDQMEFTASEPAVRRADELQVECDEGPCLHASMTGQVLVVEDTSRDPRWSVWGPLVAEMGWRSVVSTPLVASSKVVGALNLYSRAVSGFDRADVNLAGMFAAHASTALAWAADTAGLQQAVLSRHLVGQAQGILMERYGLDTDQAFGVLRRYSQDNNVKLRTVAEQIVTTGQIPGRLTSPAAPAEMSAINS